MKAVNQNQKPTKVRVRVLLFIFVCVVINYMDRSNISVAASKLGDDLNLSSVQLGLIFQPLAGLIVRCKYREAVLSTGSVRGLFTVLL